MAESRISNFKKTFRNERVSQALRKKNDVLRHDKRGAAFQKKRTKSSLDESDSKLECSYELFSSLLSDMNECTDILRKLNAIKSLRKLLCRENEGTPIQTFLDHGVGDSLSKLLISDCLTDSLIDTELKSEAAWCIACVTSGGHDEIQRMLPAAPALIRLLTRPPCPPNNRDLHEHCCLALGNVAIESEANRDILLQHGCLSPLVHLVRGMSTRLTQVNNQQNDQEQEQEQERGAIERVLPTVMWATGALARGSSAHALALIDTGVIPLLLELCGWEKCPVAVSAEAAWIMTYLTATASVDGDGVTDSLLRLGLLQSMVSRLSVLSLTEPTAVPFLRTLFNLSYEYPHWPTLLGHDDLRAHLMKALHRSLDVVSGVHRAVLKESLLVTGALLEAGTAGGLSEEETRVLVQAVVEVLRLSADQFDLQCAAVMTVHHATHSEFWGTSSLSTLLSPVIETLVKLIRGPDQETALASVRLLAGLCCPEMASTSGSSASGVSVDGTAANACREAGLMDALDDTQYGSGEEELRHAAALLADILYADEEEREAEGTGHVSEGGAVGGQSVFAFRPEPDGVGRGRGMHLTVPAWSTQHH